MAVKRNYGEQKAPLTKAKLNELIEELKTFYPLPIEDIALLRNVGGSVFLIKSDQKNYILKLYAKERSHIAKKSFSLACFLEANNIDALKVFHANKDDLCVLTTGEVGYLCRYIEVAAAENKNMAMLGEYVANVHNALAAFSGELPKYEKYYYIDRLVNLLYECDFEKEKILEIEECGEQLWKRISHLGNGIIHGDLNETNILVDSKERAFLIDFDSACNSFLLYDVATLCETFRHKPYSKEQMIASRKNFMDFCSGYQIKPELNVFFDLITLRRFELNANVLEKIKNLKIPALNTLIKNEVDRLLEWEKQKPL